MDSENLKPCPFCGGRAVVSFRGKPENGGFFVVGCTTCKATMAGDYYRGSSDELYNKPYPLSEMMGASKSVENWNRRANDALSLVLHLELELAATKLERDALFADIKQCNDCYFCKHYGTNIDVEPCQTCILDFQQQDFKPGFVWRGVCPENMVVSPDA